MRDRIEHIAINEKFSNNERIRLADTVSFFWSIKQNFFQVWNAERILCASVKIDGVSKTEANVRFDCRSKRN